MTAPELLDFDETIKRQWRVHRERSWMSRACVSQYSVIGAALETYSIAKSGICTPVAGGSSHIPDA